jgi:hypothetical protein
MLSIGKRYSNVDHTYFNHFTHLFLIISPVLRFALRIHHNTLGVTNTSDLSPLSSKRGLISTRVSCTVGLEKKKKENIECIRFLPLRDWRQTFPFFNQWSVGLMFTTDLIIDNKHLRKVKTVWQHLVVGVLQLIIILFISCWSGKLSFEHSKTQSSICD